MMARKRIIAALCALVVVALASKSAASDMPGAMTAPNLTGPMADMRYLLGIWNCAVQLPATSAAGAPASDVGTLSFETAPGQTIATATRARDYSADGYWGYDAKTKTYWSTGIDNSGNAWWESSKDAKTYSGTTSGAGAEAPIRDTFTKVSATKIHDLTQLQIKGQWTTLADAACTKS